MDRKGDLWNFADRKKHQLIVLMCGRRTEVKRGCKVPQQESGRLGQCLLFTAVYESWINLKAITIRGRHSYLLKCARHDTIY